MKEAGCKVFSLNLFRSGRGSDAEVMSSKNLSSAEKRSYSWLGSGQCMIIQGSWKVLKYSKLFMCTLKTIGIWYLCVYTLNCIVCMLAEAPLWPEVWHFGLSQHASVSSGADAPNGWWSKVEEVSGVLSWRCGRVPEQSSATQGCANSETGALLGNTGTALRLQPRSLTEMLLLCASPSLCFDVLWKK